MENKQLRIALAGNPNSGKTTLFNKLTGSNQFVGNWPGVTVEKKEGKLIVDKEVVLTDLPGIYSLSPYTLEEVVARNYLIEEKPDAILNIVDATNLERNLYLTTQLTELGIPVVLALNMMDLVKKAGDSINVKELSRQLGCPIVEISALKGDGVKEAALAAIDAAKSGKTIPQHSFSGPVEHALAHIEEVTVHDLPEERQRWYAIKLFERDEKVVESLSLSDEVKAHIEKDIAAAEKELDDDAESIITNERYIYIGNMLKGIYKKKGKGQLSASDKIDKIVTNRILALPIFIVVMFLVYALSMGTSIADGGVRRLTCDPRRLGRRALARRPDLRRYLCRRRRGARLCAADARPVPDALPARGLRLHGPYRLHHGPDLPPLRTERQELHPDARRHRLRHSGRHGLAHH